HSNTPGDAFAIGSDERQLDCSRSRARIRDRDACIDVWSGRAISELARVKNCASRIASLRAYTTHVSPEQAARRQDQEQYRGHAREPARTSSGVATAAHHAVPP